MTGAGRVLWLGLALAVHLGAPRVASAQFDLVEAYQERVKGFEAIYYLEEADRWARDRRVFEAFGTGHWLRRDPDNEYFGEALLHWNAGLLVNIDPAERGALQLTLFSLTNQLRFRVHDVTEMLHGARVTFGELLEVSLGGYWLLENTRQTFGNGQASVFAEVNLPFMFLKSSYVFGAQLDRDDDALLRFDIRLVYDELRFVDDVELDVTRYNLSDAENVLVSAGFTRLGTHDFRFLSGKAVWSVSEGRLGLLEGGLDLLLQLDDDFNATRRGHFGTSFGLEAIATYASPLAYRRYRPRVSLLDAETPLLGYRAVLSMQVPFKWVLTFLAAVGGATAAGLEDDPYRRQQLIDDTSAMVQDTVEHPEDELFARLNFTYAYNDPGVLEMFPGFSDQHRFYLSMGVMY